METLFSNLVYASVFSDYTSLCTGLLILNCHAEIPEWRKSNKTPRCSANARPGRQYRLPVTRL